MKLRTSPVFYFGIALVMLVAAALAAPFYVDWTQYRASLEEYGQRLTGRDVKAAGDIEVRLFPWPKLSVGDVTISNPEGFEERDFMRIERMDVRVSLAGLFNGTLDVQAVDLFGPDIAVERTIDGRNNWQIVPKLALKDSRVLEHVRLDQIAIHNGRLRVADRRRTGELEIQRLGGTLSAPSVGGPWRVRMAGEHDGIPRELSINTGQWVSGQPFKFAARVARSNGSGLAASLEGGLLGEAINGTLDISPASTGGNEDSKGALRALAFHAKIKADPDALALTGIEIAPREQTPESGGTVLEGAASFEIGPAIGFEADLKSAKFDLDAALGARAMEMFRAKGRLSLVSELFALMPEGLSGRGRIKVATLRAGGENLQNADLDISVSAENLRVNRFSARLPGQTGALFEGLLIGTKDGPQLAGDLAIETQNARELLKWALPGRAGAIDALWTGSRGRLKLQSKIDISAAAVRLAQADYELDGARGVLAFSADDAGGEVRLEADMLDIDAFIPQGVLAVAPRGDMGWTAIQAALPSLAELGPLKLVVQAAKLKLNGIVAEDVAIDARMGPAGLDLKIAEIGKVGEARLEASGLVANGTDGPRGSLAAKIVAEHPRGLLKLLGFAGQGSEPPWIGALGKTALDATAFLQPDSGAPGLNLTAKGTSGDFAVDGTLALAGSLDWRVAELSGAGKISSASSQALMRLAGFIPFGSADMPGQYEFTATGSVANGMVADMQAELFGARGQVQIKPGAAGLEGVARFSARQPGILSAALGAPTAIAGPLEAEADFIKSAAGLEVPVLNGKSGKSAFSGAFAMTADRRLSGQFDVDDFSLGPLLTAALLPWSGASVGLEGPFAKGLPFGATGEIWIKPKRLDVFGMAELSELQIGLTAERAETRISAFGKMAGGENVTVELALMESAGETKAEATLALPLSLQALLKREEARPVLGGALAIDGRFSGQGRSPAAVLASLSGAGSYALKGGRIEGLSPGDFLAAAEAADSQAALDGAFAALTAGGALEAGDRAGTITAVKGVASFLPFTVKSEFADVALTPSIDLAAGALDLGMDIAFKSKEPLPSMRISYAGEPDALASIVDSSQLLSALGIRVLKRGVAELERLQREQQKIAEEEERQRAEDAARVAAWEAHRREVIKLVRDMKMRAAQRELAIRQAKEDAKRRLIEGAQINKLEIPRRLRDLKEARRRKLAEKKDAEKRAAEAERAALAAAAAAASNEPIFGAEGTQSITEPLPKPKSKPQLRIEKPKAGKKLYDPVADARDGIILVPPAKEPLGPKKPSIMDRLKN